MWSFVFVHTYIIEICVGSEKKRTNIFIELIFNVLPFHFVTICYRWGCKVVAGGGGGGRGVFL
jgi:hypothetical protein